jgi:hypothetical protein
VGDGGGDAGGEGEAEGEEGGFRLWRRGEVRRGGGLYVLLIGMVKRDGGWG